MGYSTKGHLIGWLLTVLTAIPWIAFLLMAAEQASDEQFDYPKIYTWIGIGAGVWLVGSQLLSMAFVFIFTTAFHGGLLITGSSPREIDVTFSKKRRRWPVHRGTKRHLSVVHVLWRSETNGDGKSM